MSGGASIIIASGNRGKIVEIQNALAHLPITLSSQEQHGIANAAETRKTFVENALDKARWVAKQSGNTAPVLADDSGLIVPALNNAPGLYSARYAGSERDDKKNNQKLLAAMENINNRAAAYYAVIVLIKNEDDPQPVIAEGCWRGSIARAPAGDNGFGYDPLFYDETLQKTAAQLTMQEKNKVSHRGQSLRHLTTALAAAPHLFA